MIVISLLLIAISLLRFGVDIWIYFYACYNSKGTSVIHLNYRGAGGVLSCVVALALFLLLYKWRES